MKALASCQADQQLAKKGKSKLGDMLEKAAELLMATSASAPGRHVSLGRAGAAVTLRHGHFCFE